MNISERLAGAVWGHLVGDAVGVPYEFKSPSQIRSIEFRGHGSHNQPAGTWSDDGALMLAPLDSLLRPGATEDDRFDPEDQAKRFLNWSEGTAYTPDGDGRFDIGGATAAAMRRLSRGVPPEQAGGTDERDNGNGSLMRILPIALVERRAPHPVLIDMAHRASAITHGHAISQSACALYTLVANRLLAGSPRESALADARTMLRNAYGARPDAGARLLALDALESWIGRSGRGFVVDSFWSAWDAFAGAKNYRETIERAVRYGGDTDTTACIAGGLAGLRFGVEAIPADWLEGMRGKSIAEPLVERLRATVEGDASSSHKASVAAPAQVAPKGSRTSETDPIRVAFVDLNLVPKFVGWPGRIGMTFLPGKRDDGLSGRHWRDLGADVALLREKWKADTFLLLVEDHELARTQVSGIKAAMASHDIELLRFPIVDGEVPTDEGALHQLLETLKGRIQGGQTVVVACRGGLGRTGTVVACLLREGGLGADEAMALTRSTRHSTIENATQESFVRAWA